MGKLKFSKKVISVILSASMTFSLIGYSSVTASAFDENYISKDGMALGYSIVNGYTKLTFKNNPDSSSGKIAVYSGLDVTNPGVIAVGGMYIFSHNISIDKLLSDNDYAMENIKKFDKFLSAFGIKNERAENFKKSISDEDIEFESEFDTVGIYVFEADNDYALDLMNNKYADFVLAGGKVPESMKDLNFDGKSDSKDAILIQRYLVDDLTFEDKDEDAYAMFACDINADKEINIFDATDLQYQDLK